MDKPAPFKEERYGFTWGPLTIERLISVEVKNGHHVIALLQTQKEQIEIRVTPTGLIRIGDVIKREKKSVT